MPPQGRAEHLGFRFGGDRAVGCPYQA